MSTLFISHSSEDSDLAEELVHQLREQGHHSLFLDFDPACGIPPGQNWEQALYRKLRAAKAVVALCTDHFLASSWCFAEVAMARMQGKLVFGLLADPLSQQLPGILTSCQLIDLRRGFDEGFRRLAGVLEEVQLLRVVGEWDPRQPPYLGLDAYHEKHAPIFFGREDETRDGVEVLSRGAPGLIVVLGASGSGKSSLVRAGIVPALRRVGEHWLIVEPFRPGRDPFAELAESLLTTLARHDPPRAAQLGPAPELARELAGERPSGAGPVTVEPPSPDRLIDLVLDLQRAADRRDSRVLLVVDQLEEVLGQKEADVRSERFLAFLRAAVEEPGSPLTVLATLPSDFLEPFISAAALRGVDFENLSLGPMRIDGMRRVIEEPARLAALELEPGLADRLLEDAETPDALPLLSFTLWVLWRDYRRNDRLEVRDYERLGGLEAAVTKEADALLAAARREDQEDALRRAFLYLSRLSPEGRYARRLVPWEAEEITAARPILERFVARRLLVRRAEGATPMVEVAHEALFRSWGPLHRWLDNNRAEMLLRDQVHRDAAAWREAGCAPDQLWSGGRLQQAGELLSRGGLDSDERRFITTGLRRRRMRQVTLVAATLAIMLLLAAFLVAALHQKSQSDRARRTAQNLAKAGIGSTLVEDDPTHSNLLLLEVANPDALPFVMAAIHRALNAPLRTTLLAPVKFELAQSFNREGTLLVSLEVGGARPSSETESISVAEGVASVWDASSGRAVRVLGAVSDDVGSKVQFSPIRNHVLAITESNTVRVVDALSGEILVAKHLPGELHFAVYSDDGQRIAALTAQEAYVLDASSGDLIAKSQLREGTVEYLATDEDILAALLVHGPLPLRFDGERLAVLTGRNSLWIWDVEAPNPRGSVLSLSESILDFSLNANRLLTISEGRRLRLRDLATGELIVELDQVFPGSPTGSLSPDGTRAAITTQEGPSLVLDLSDLPTDPFDQPWVVPSVELEDPGLPRPPSNQWHEGATPIVFTSDGQRLVGGGVWDAKTGWLLMKLDGEPTAITRDGRKLAVVRALGTQGEKIKEFFPIEILQLPASAELTEGTDGACSWCDAALQGSSPRSDSVLGVVAPGGQRHAREDMRPIGEGAVAMVEILDAKGSLIRSVRGHRPRFSSDGRLLLTLTELTATVWDAQSARRLTVIVGHQGRISDALFSPDGSWLVTASASEGSVRVWHAESGTAIAEFRRLYEPHLSPVEEEAMGVALEFEDEAVPAAVPDDDSPFTEGVEELTDWPVESYLPAEVEQQAERPVEVGEPHSLVNPRYRPPGEAVESAQQPELRIGIKADGTRLVTDTGSRQRIWALSGELLQALIRSRTNRCLEPEHRSKRLRETKEAAWTAFDRCERCLGRCPLPALRQEWLGESPSAASAAYEECQGQLAGQEMVAPTGDIEESWQLWKSCFGSGA